MALPSQPTKASSALQCRLALDIARHIKASELAAGETINQLALAQHFHVSRTPVRAALLMLAEAGVVSLDGRGARVLNPDAELPSQLEPVDHIAELITRIAEDRRRDSLADEVSEADLMRQYGAPRPDITAALRRLADLGVAIRKPGFGWRFLVNTETAEEKRAAYRFRLAIEPAALLEPGYHAAADWLSRMRHDHEGYLMRRWRQSDAVPFFEMNAAFHHELIGFSGNRFFIQATEQQNRLRRLRNYSWHLGEERVAVSCRDHLSIIEALEQGDHVEAARRLRLHLEQTALVV